MDPQWQPFLVPPPYDDDPCLQPAEAVVPAPNLFYATGYPQEQAFSMAPPGIAATGVPPPYYQQAPQEAYFCQPAPAVPKGYEEEMWSRGSYSPEPRELRKDGKNKTPSHDSAEFPPKKKRHVEGDSEGAKEAYEDLLHHGPRCFNEERQNGFESTLFRIEKFPARPLNFAAERTAQKEKQRPKDQGQGQQRDRHREKGGKDGRHDKKKPRHGSPPPPGGKNLKVQQQQKQQHQRPPPPPPPPPHAPAHSGSPLVCSCNAVSGPHHHSAPLPTIRTMPHHTLPPMGHHHMAPPTMMPHMSMAPRLPQVSAASMLPNPSKFPGASMLITPLGPPVVKYIPLGYGPVMNVPTPMHRPAYGGGRMMMRPPPPFMRRRPVPMIPGPPRHHPGLPVRRGRPMPMMPPPPPPHRRNSNFFGIPPWIVVAALLMGTLGAIMLLLEFVEEDRTRRRY